MAKAKATRSTETRQGAQTGMIRARIDPALKLQAETILATLGLNASDAIRLYYKQIALSNGLPFDVRIPNAETRKVIRDARAGKNVKSFATTDELFEDLGI